MFFLCVCFTTLVNAQLDSVTISASVSQTIIFSDSINSTDFKNVSFEIWMNDVDSFSEVLLAIFEENTDIPVYLKKHNKSQLSLLNIINGNTLSFKPILLEVGKTYTITCTVQTTDGLFLSGLKNVITIE